MTTINRYELTIKDVQSVAMPRRARVLSAEAKPGDSGISVWALVDDDEEMEDRLFKIVGTGQHLGIAELGGYNFLNTVIMTRWDGVVFCWHVFMESP